MSSVIYSNRRDFLLIIEINLILWVVLFFLGFFGLFVCLFYILMPNSRQTMVFYLKKKIFSLLINIQYGDVFGIQSRDI